MDSYKPRQPALSAMNGRGVQVATGALGSLVALAATAAPTAAHVDYVSPGETDPLDPLGTLIAVLGDPLNAALVGGGIVAVGLLLVGYLTLRPAAADVAALRGALGSYQDLVPWMLRLSVGLPLVGAGYGGYLFSPAVQIPARQLQVALGFLLLFGLATRAVAIVGLGVYLAAVVAQPDLLLAMEYVPGFLAIALLGSGRPSADNVLQRVASADGTVYGQIDPIHRVAAWLNARLEAYTAVVPTVLRVGIGLSFVYLGVVQKLGDPASALAVVEKYSLTSVVPVDPGLWVVGAGLVEAAVGLALIVGLFTRASAGTAFCMLTLTLFGLPDDPVLAHVTLFGMTSALVTVGGGPWSVDRWLHRRTGSAPTTDEPAPA